MSMNINPPPLTALGDALALLRLVQNPKEAGDLLEKIGTATAEHNDALQKILGRDDALNAREQDISSRESAIEKRISEASAREDAVGVREQNVAALEPALAQRKADHEKSVAAERAELSALKAKLTLDISNFEAEKKNHSTSAASLNAELNARQKQIEDDRKSMIARQEELRKLLG